MNIETIKGKTFDSTDQVSKEGEQDLDKLAELAKQGVDIDKVIQEVEKDEI
jgi:hypothetical protein